MKQPTPDPTILPAGGKLRFALGSDQGARSSVWSVVGHKNTDDIYIGARDVLGIAKLSLHESGKWRRALTDREAERRNLPDDVDRVLSRWEVPEPIVDGWLHAASITIPSSSVQNFGTGMGPAMPRHRGRRPVLSELRSRHERYAQ
jgi:hypothetical protein